MSHSTNSSKKEFPLKDPPSNKRYFIMKSLNYQNISTSMECGIWTTQSHNEETLNQACENSAEVILIFSVNLSKHFQGFARMTSRIGGQYSNVWITESNTMGWASSFQVEWIAIHELPFSETLHLHNSWNDNKPVKISRDGQELPPEIGQALCDLISRGANLNTKPPVNEYGEPIIVSNPAKKEKIERDKQLRELTAEEFQRLTYDEYLTIMNDEYLSVPFCYPPAYIWPQHRKQEEPKKY
jgi:hypothetical protein